MKKAYRISQKNEFEQLIIGSDLHPVKLISLLAQLFISMIIIGLLISLTVTLPEVKLKASSFPIHFFTGTVFLFSVIFCLAPITNYYLKENKKYLIINFVSSTVFSIFFYASMLLSWKKLFNTELYLEGSYSSIFFMLLCSSQMAYFFMVLCLQVWSCVRVCMVSANEIKSLLFFGNKLEIARLESVFLIWKFSLFNWVAIVFFFLYRFLYSA